MTAALFTFSQDMEAYKMSIIRGVSQEVIRIYDAIVFSHEKEKIIPFAAAWTDLEKIILSQTEKDKYMTSLVCGT